ncbi:MAG: hypothetical protein VKS61_15655 [Candidatus Sericytochromatia bacterium]|nr:hypothetical protein [Candidatus Sericytochromatia bacterium]
MHHHSTRLSLLLASALALGCAAPALAPLEEDSGKVKQRGNGTPKAGTSGSDGAATASGAKGTGDTSGSGLTTGAGAGSGLTTGTASGTVPVGQGGASGTVPTGGLTGPTPTPPPINPATGQGINQQTGDAIRGTVDALPGEKTLATPKPTPITFTVLTADGTPANYFFAGNTVFIEASGLKAGDKYSATLVWPNGKKTMQEFTADEGGNMQGPQGKFIEYPHAGFYNVSVIQGQKVVVTGEFMVELRHVPTDAVVGERPFAVRPGPVIFSAGRDRRSTLENPVYTQRTLYFSDTFEEVYLHGEGFEPGTQLVINMIQANVNRQNPMPDGLLMTDKLVSPFTNLTYQCNDDGVFDAKVNSWFTREAVKDSMVIIGKYLNDSPNFVRAEDIAITDHPTFLIKNSKDFFDAIGVTPGGGPTP